MGAGASIPDKLDLEKTKELAGERFDDGQFETMAGPDGCITREQLLEAGNLVDFDASKLTEEVARNGMFFSFNEFDEDDSGGLSYEEWVWQTVTMAVDTELNLQLGEFTLRKNQARLRPDEAPRGRAPWTCRGRVPARPCR